MIGAKRCFLGLAVCGAFATGCADSDGTAGSEGTTGGGLPATSTLSLSFERLPVLGASSVYEGWVIVNDAPVSTGRFTVGADGATTPAMFEVEGAGANMFVLTIEPAAGDDPAPSATHVLAGPIAGGKAELTAAHDAAIGESFASAAGAYVLATPSTMADMGDETQGIWWVDPASMAATLELPAAPTGWRYEGWVIGADGPVSTGWFEAVSGADSDGSGEGAGPDAGPPFPGQDFITPALELVGLETAITLEPVPDDSPMPYGIKPLGDEIDDVAAPSTQPMQNTAAMSLPAGVATFQ